MSKESINVGHSRFLAESKPGTKWKENSKIPGNGGLDHPVEEYDTLPLGKGSSYFMLSLLCRDVKVIAPDK